MMSKRLLDFVILDPTYSPIGVIAVSAPKVKRPIPTIRSKAPMINERSIAFDTGKKVTSKRRTISVTGRTDERDSEIFSRRIVLSKSFIIFPLF
jgi:hypothetical protein